MLFFNISNVEMLFASPVSPQTQFPLQRIQSYVEVLAPGAEAMRELGGNVAVRTTPADMNFLDLDFRDSLPFDLQPKNRGPFQRAPVISRATSERLEYVLPA